MSSWSWRIVDLVFRSVKGKGSYLPTGHIDGRVLAADSNRTCAGLALDNRMTDLQLTATGRVPDSQ